MSILIVDDHPIVQQGIISILQMHNIQDTVLQACTLKEAEKILYDKKIDIVLLDIKLGCENGLDLVKKLHHDSISTKILVITASDNLQDYKQAMNLNIDGYLLKDEFVEDILYAIRVIKRGEKFFSNTCMRKMQEQNTTSGLRELTERERDVYRLMKRGLSNADIADELFITQYTVKKHISNVLSKLNLKNRVEVILYEDGINLHM